ncbi:MAG: hypothetical protein FJX28_03430 [Alphaproteobacteria bacterium]|nr:hypothetical protein [Alphaproteobacteria bacterium]
MPVLPVPAARDLIRSALTGSGLALRHSSYLTEAIVDTELSGLDGHGFYWLDYYCQHLRSGKVNGAVDPEVTVRSASSFRVDARRGFAHSAIEAGFARLIPAAKAQGIAAMGVFNSYNAATLGFHTGTLARAGLLAIGATNAVPTVAPVAGIAPSSAPTQFLTPCLRQRARLRSWLINRRRPWRGRQSSAPQIKGRPFLWAGHWTPRGPQQQTPWRRWPGQWPRRAV